MGKLKTTEQFIADAISIHGDKYDYSKVVYTKKDNKVIIICKKHGEFEQCANSHVLGMGCQKCGGNYRYDTNGFIEKSRLIHGDTYIYSSTDYKNNQTKVIIICKIHGPFEQKPNNHLQGNGCPNCKGDRIASKQKKPIEQFIQESTNRFGDKYDYSKVNYINAYTDIIIECKIHGEFVQSPKTHLKGIGCIKCYGKYTLPQEEFINNAIQIHNINNSPIYDYSNVCVVNNKTPVDILCFKHGVFSQIPYLHLKGHGCTTCGHELTIEQKNKRQQLFIEKSREIYGELYDYSHVNYNGSNEKVEIVCKRHGSFYKTPDNHIHVNSPQGCPECSFITRCEKGMLTADEIIQRAKETHGDKYDYSKVEYTGIYEKIIIICKEHGEFEQSANSHIRGRGCYECVKTIWTTEKIIEKSKETHGDKYDYSNVEYTGKIHNKIIIMCKQHGVFEQRAVSHIRGCGCPMCINKTEGKLYEKLLPLYPTLITQFKQKWCKKTSYLPFDFCIPEHKIIIELDGPQHFQQISNWSSPEEQFENDKYKEKCANENGYSVIRLLQEDVFYDTYDWTNKLCESIEEIKNGGELSNVYLCINDEYDVY